jgi:hypothetical protein
VPRISAFFGIVIAMYHNDHAPPHFHALYAEHEAEILIETFGTHKGSLPRRAHSLVLEWASLHREELWGNWERARRGEPLKKIEPLE